MKPRPPIKIDWHTRYHYNYGPKDAEKKEIFWLLIGSAILTVLLALLSVVGLSF